VSYLDCHPSYQCKIAEILFDLRYFSYSKAVVRVFSEDIRRTQKLCLVSDLCLFLSQKKLLLTDVPFIFEGILKLYDHFMAGFNGS